MSLFGCKDDSLLWFIILFLLLFCTGNGGDCKTGDADYQNNCGHCLR